jgi:hypothetical protein
MPSQPHWADRADNATKPKPRTILRGNRLDQQLSSRNFGLGHFIIGLVGAESAEQFSLAVGHVARRARQRIPGGDRSPKGRIWSGAGPIARSEQGGRITAA